MPGLNLFPAGEVSVVVRGKSERGRSASENGRGNGNGNVTGGTKVKRWGTLGGEGNLTLL